MREARIYRFGRAEHPGVIAGVRWGQAVVVLVGASGMVAALSLIESHVSAGAVALGIAALAGAVAFVPIGGEPVDRWLTVASAQVWRRARGRRRWTSPAPQRGRWHREGDGPTVEGSAAERRRDELPPALVGVRILGVASRHGEIGVIRQGATWTVVLATEGGPFALLDREDQERRLAGWGSVLASLARAGSPISRLQWVERTGADGVDEPARYLAERRKLPRGHRALESYLELLAGAGPAARRHDVLVALQVDGRRAARAVKRAGGGDAGGCAIVVREALALVQRLGGAEVAVRGALTPRMIVRALRDGLEPRLHAVEDWPEAPGEGAPDAIEAAPIAAEEAWGHYRADSASHATFWVERLPVAGAPADFLAPLLLDGLAQRTVSVVMEPIDPRRAVRAAERTACAT